MIPLPSVGSLSDTKPPLLSLVQMDNSQQNSSYQMSFGLSIIYIILQVLEYQV